MDVYKVAQNLHNRLDTIASRNVYSLILVMTSISFIVLFISLPALFVLDSYFPLERIQDNHSQRDFFLLAVVIAPIVETFLFQLIPIVTLKKWVKSKLLIIVISSVLFSISHLSSYTYAFSNLLGGAVLAYAYIISMEKKYPPYACTAVVHSLRNLIVFMASLVFPI